jgi:hypothetical protein
MGRVFDACRGRPALSEISRVRDFGGELMKDSLLFRRTMSPSMKHTTTFFQLLVVAAIGVPRPGTPSVKCARLSVR